MRDCARRCAIDVPARPQLEAHQRPDALGVIAAALLVLLQQRAPPRAERVQPRCARSRIEQDVARPADQPFLEPPAQRHAEAALRPRAARRPAPTARITSRNSRLVVVRVAVARRRLRAASSMTW